MLQQHRNWYRTLAAALAASAIAPATAAAVPASDGSDEGGAAGGGPGVTARTFRSQSLAAPGNVDRRGRSLSDGNGGIDSDVWIAIGGGVLVGAGGMGVAGRKRLQTKRQPV